MRETEKARGGLASSNRREFLKVTAAAGLTFAALLPGATSIAKADEPRRGGTLRVAILGGGANETIDAHACNTNPDNMRVTTLYEALTRIDPYTGKVVTVLAETMEPNADATEWTVKLRKGVKFHSGKILTAEDVAFSFRRIADPKQPFQGAVGLSQVDLDNLKIVDDLTLVVPMKSPNSVLPELLSLTVFYNIVPVGYDPKAPVGTGPFRYESFTPGQQSVFTRFDDYWQGAPHLDSVVVISSFQSDTAAFNALQGGEVDVYALATLSLASQVKAQGGNMKTLVGGATGYMPFCFRVDVAPFDNADVRNAFRLLVDRQQIIDQTVNGFGILASDVFSPIDPAFDKSLQRQRDVEQAKALLKKAGHENLAVDLTVADLQPGMLLGAQVFAQQAKAGGVDVTIRQVSSDQFFADYGKWPFFVDFWEYLPYLTQVAFATLPTSPYNGTHFNNTEYTSLYTQALATVDLQKRYEIIREMQRIDFDQGSFVIPCFVNVVDLLASNVEGFVPAVSGKPLGHDAFAKAWLSA